MQQHRKKIRISISEEQEINFLLKSKSPPLTRTDSITAGFSFIPHSWENPPSYSQECPTQSPADLHHPTLCRMFSFKCCKNNEHLKAKISVLVSQIPVQQHIPVGLSSALLFSFADRSQRDFFLSDLVFCDQRASAFSPAWAAMSLQPLAEEQNEKFAAVWQKAAGVKLSPLFSSVGCLVFDRCSTRRLSEDLMPQSPSLQLYLVCCVCRWVFSDKRFVWFFCLSLLLSWWYILYQTVVFKHF